MRPVPVSVSEIRADYGTGPLYLCGHHARKGWVVLERTALRIRADVPTGSFYLPMPPRKSEL